MRILVVNVNTTECITQAIGDSARSVASPGTEIIGLTPNFGADSMRRQLRKLPGRHRRDGQVVTLHRAVRRGHPGRLRRARPRGPAGAARRAGRGHHRGRRAVTALFLGHNYSVVTTLDRTVPLIEDRLKLAGLDRSLRLGARQRAGGARARVRSGARGGSHRATGRGRGDDKAEVICLGCGGMAGARGTGCSGDRGTGRRWRAASGDDRRIPGPAGPDHLERSAPMRRRGRRS